MIRPALALLALMPAAALADADPKFVRLRDSAEPLGGLGTFLGKYIGECSDILSGPQCKSNAQEFRRTATGKRFYMIINEDSAGMLQPGPYDPGRGIWTLHITPFFPAAGYAVTHGAPKSTDGNGNPRMPLIKMRGKVPTGWNASSINRLFSSRALRVQVVFKPEGVWTLTKKGGEKIQGVKAKIEAILVTVGRSGEEIGLWTPG